jgi:hypothetical protein
MTLSHCWGKEPIFTLTTDNYETMLQRIPLSHLQQVFRDAISVTQKAEIKYLWIDSLCIIQDSVEDWRRESMNMGMVYSGAVCNIAATGFPDGSNGLFIETDASLSEPTEVQLNADVTAREGECFRKGDYHLVDFLSWSNGVDNAPLNKRGWVVQERFLSPRIMRQAIILGMSNSRSVRSVSPRTTARNIYQQGQEVGTHGPSASKERRECRSMGLQQMGKRRHCI